MSKYVTLMNQKYLNNSTLPVIRNNLSFSVAFRSLKLRVSQLFWLWIKLWEYQWRFWPFLKDSGTTFQCISFDRSQSYLTTFAAT